MLSALIGREMAEPAVSPATQPHRWVAASCCPGDPEQWRLGHTPYSGAMLVPIVVSLRHPEQRCQIPHGILKIYLRQDTDWREGSGAKGAFY